MPKPGQNPAREGYLKPGAREIEAAINRLSSPKAILKQAVATVKKNVKSRMGY
jgi:hypothetical protein